MAVKSIILMFLLAPGVLIKAQTQDPLVTLLINKFHLKARALRLGVNFEWLDPAPKTTITGRLEVDFEGDFTRVNNRNISSIRASQPSLCLAWARIDRCFNEKITGFALFGQDWTSFVSSTLPNTIENTSFGGIGYGAAYERAPQIRTGFNYNFGGARSWKLQPEFAIVFPAFADVPTNVADQLGFGERQGADGNQPASQGRVVVQWLLDKQKVLCRRSLSSVLNMLAGARSLRRRMRRRYSLPPFHPALTAAIQGHYQLHNSQRQV
jgi:hypothetical protein